MSATTSAIDRRVRRTLVLIAIMLSIPIIWAVYRYVASAGESKVATSPAAADERLVVVDGQTMIVAPGTVGEAMTTWLESRKTKTLAFELSDQSFRPNSAAPARITVTRANQVAAVVSESPTLKVHILEPAHLRSAAAERLDQQRAHRLRDELLARGVEGSRVTIGRQQKEPSGPDSPHVIVVLSK